MTDAEISPVKNTVKDVSYHVEQIRIVEKKTFENYLHLASIFYNAKTSLNEEQFADFSAQLENWTPSKISKLTKVGEFISGLPEAERKCLPRNETTLYLIAASDMEVRNQAFDEGFIHLKLTKKSWEDYVHLERKVSLLKSLSAEFGNIHLEEAMERLKN
jgi:hypothetical protein